MTEQPVSMRVVKSTRPVSVYALMVLLLFLSVGALFGGVMLMLYPRDGGLGLPVNLLEGSPFSSLRLPGLILFSVLGVLPLVTSVALWLEPEWRFARGMERLTHRHGSWLAGLGVGSALVIWISVQGMMLGFGNPLQWFYLGLGFVIILVSFLPSVQRHYTLRGKP